MYLICLPHAGGLSTVYKEWSKYLNPHIKLHAVELAGRGSRVEEAFYKSLDQMIEDILCNIRPIIEQNNYALFGHSMGSLCAYELYFKIREKGLNEPSHIFFSGYGAPEKESECEMPDVSKMEDNDFMAFLKNIGGTPNEILENEELRNLFVPVIKNDFKLIREYNFVDKGKIDSAISVFYGNRDSISLENLLEWKNCTSKKCRFQVFDGDHFYIYKNITCINQLIKHIILS